MLRNIKMKPKSTEKQIKPESNETLSAGRIIRSLLRKLELQQLTDKEIELVELLKHDHSKQQLNDNISRQQLEKAVKRNREKLRSRGVASTDIMKKRVNSKLFMIGTGVLSVAATLLLLFSLQLFLKPHQNNVIEMQGNPITAESRYTTTNQMKKILLVDGSSVYLNKESTLLLKKGRFNAFIREVWLEEGEAFFDVSKDPHRPFIVYTAGGISTRVLGTSFNIQAYKALDRQVISVNSGKVQVFNAEEEGILLESNYKVSISGSNGTFTGGTTQAAILSDWRSGYIVFENAPMKEVSLRLKQNFGLVLSYDESHFANDLIYSSFNSNTPEAEILAVICKLLHASYTREGSMVHIKKTIEE